MASHLIRLREDCRRHELMKLVEKRPNGVAVDYTNDNDNNADNSNDHDADEDDEDN